MKSSVVFCVLLGAVLSVRTASVPPSVDAAPVNNTLTELYDYTTQTMTTPYTTPYTILDTTAYPEPDTTSYSTLDTTPYPTVTSTPFPSTQTSPSPSQIMCPDGWEVFQGRCYYFVDEGMTWPQAQSNCAMLESMLASVDSVQEYGFLQQLTSNTGNQDAWLGGFYLQDQWLWLDGSWFYNNSLSIESPDSSNPCLMLNIYEGGFNSPCDAGGYVSICEKSSNVPLTMVCPEGWTGFQGRCYFYNGDSLTWSEAETNCVGLQASLVSVHSPQQYFFLYQQTAVNGFSNVWLGGFYLEDQWMWLDGSWFYQGFSDQMSQGSTSPCLSTYDTNGWSNYDCEQSFPSFCVKNEVV
ncbi:macrophage mannose receptor 1-like [Thunnus maccoyii]|uniref:macrophage mannose receptor 1-like n=1 Tax=Thunnus maccoyii TaxID=8240 RepID=UPI001C4BB6C9|nr:macrophage mannose receptor 1-like [Thunnus maccoyii]